MKRYKFKESWIERIKFWIAKRLDKNPEYCWANLVMWSLGYRPWYILFWESHIEYDLKDRSCPLCSDYPYCGKCADEMGFIMGEKGLMKKDDLKDGEL